MKTKISLSVLATMALLVTSEVHALGIGDAVVHSKLNEPLNVELSLVSADAIELHNLSPALANQEEFDKAGIHRSAILANIHFELEKNAEDKPIIRLTTIDAIKDPSLTLLVEMNSPEGRLLKEYTLLLDPPNYVTSTSAVLDTPKMHMSAEDADLLMQDFPELVLSWQTMSAPSADKIDIVDKKGKESFIKSPVAENTNNNNNNNNNINANQPQQALKLIDPNEVLSQKLKQLEGALNTLQKNNETLMSQQQALIDENHALTQMAELKEKEAETLKTQLNKMLEEKQNPIQSNQKLSQTAPLLPILEQAQPVEENASSTSHYFWIAFAMVFTLIITGFMAAWEFSRRRKAAGEPDAATLFPMDVNNKQEENFDIDEAVIALVDAHNVKPSSILDVKHPVEEKDDASMLEEADVYISFGKVKMAESILKSLIEKNNVNTAAIVKLFDMYLNEGKTQEAQEVVEKLPVDFKNIDPQNWEKMSDFLNTIEIGKKGQEEAEDNILPVQEPFQAVSDTLKTKLDLAQVYFDMGDKESAKGLLLEVQRCEDAQYKTLAENFLKEKYDN